MGDWGGSTLEHEAELSWTVPQTLNTEQLLIVMKFAMISLSGALLVHAVPLAHLHLLHPVAVEQYVDHLLHGGVLADEETLVLALLHEDAVVYLDHATLLHLQHEPTLAPGVAVLQLRWSRFIIQHQSLLGETISAWLLYHHLQGEEEELGVPVFHLVLGQQLPDHLAGGGGAANAESLVLNVWSETRGVHLDRGLGTSLSQTHV